MRQVRLQSSRQWYNVLGQAVGVFTYTNAYTILENDQIHARLYRSSSVASRMFPIIQAMQKQPPPFVAIKQDNSALLAANWPVDLLYDKDERFCGYAVPATKEKNAYLLDMLFYNQNISPRDYRSRILVAYNIAAMLASLHIHEIAVFNLSPTTLTLNLPDLRIGVVDCENYYVPTIAGVGYAKQKRNPYYQFGAAPGENSLRLENNFALAVIIFRLLNRGMLPYQCMSTRWPGITRRVRSSTKLRIYSYQQPPDLRGSPMPGSIHRYFDELTLEMFGQAFLSPAQSPSALDWQLHLRPFIIENSEQLKPCSDNIDHAHFHRGCGLCGEAHLHPHDYNALRLFRVNLYTVIDQLFNLNLSKNYWKK